VNFDFGLNLGRGLGAQTERQREKQDGTRQSRPSIERLHGDHLDQLIEVVDRWKSGSGSTTPTS